MSEIFFAGIALATAPGLVMTPRSASEQIVAAAVERIGERPARVADVGTGSGAIAVSLALAAPHAEVWASDVSAAAVLLARLNAHRHGVGDRVHVVKGNLLAPIPGKLDVIVANLPYLPRSDSGRYPDLAGDPQGAIYGDGDGLDPYRLLLASAEEKLTPTGAVVIQLHRQVLAAERENLAELARALDASAVGAAAA